MARHKQRRPHLFDRFIAEHKRRYYKGILAEYWARLYLHSKGFRCLKQRYRTRYGEIDLIMKRGKFIVFVEVKARHTHDMALESVHTHNQKRVVAAAQCFIQAHPKWANQLFRFDVIAISCYGIIRHVPHAFHADIK